MNVEKRFHHGGVTVHARADGKGRTLSGLGAVYYRAGEPGSEYWLYADMVERIMPGAFARALKEDDIRGLFNHEVSMVLGRKSAGTARFTEDGAGLHYEIDPPAARADVLEYVERGDVTGSSFSFRPIKVAWVEEQRDGKTVYIRELHDVQVLDVGPVTFPAYESTTATVRAAGDSADARAELDAWKAQRAADGAAKLAEINRQAAIRRRALAVETLEKIL